jgi:uncharacterized membrane protein YphA (DoxX/SURF4 family)
MDTLSKPWKFAAIGLRTLLGVLFIFSSIVFFFDLIQKPELTGAMKVFSEGIEASLYLLPLLKGIELVCGIALVSGFFVPLALVVLAPITVNILMVHIFVDQTTLPVGIFVVVANIILAYVYREKYKPLLSPK